MPERGDFGGPGFGAGSRGGSFSGFDGGFSRHRGIGESMNPGAPSLAGLAGLGSFGGGVDAPGLRGMLNPERTFGGLLARGLLAALGIANPFAGFAASLIGGMLGQRARNNRFQGAIRDFDQGIARARDPSGFAMPDSVRSMLDQAQNPASEFSREGMMRALGGVSAMPQVGSRSGFAAGLSGFGPGPRGGSVRMGSGRDARRVDARDLANPANILMALQSNFLQGQRDRRSGR